jgi:hypothetical protein
MKPSTNNRASRHVSTQHRTASKPFRQPKDALTPTAFTLEAAEKWALQKSRSLPADQFRLRGFWYINYVSQAAPEERKTRYTIKLAQSEGYGRSCGLTPVLPDPDPDFVGKDARQLLRDGLCRDHIDRTALIDLIMGRIPGVANEYVELDAPLAVKYATRARIFAAEADSILRRKGFGTLKGQRPSVLVIGATAGIISALIRQGFIVSATDLAPEIVGRELGGVKVCDGVVSNARFIKSADLAIITGMSLPNGTLPQITSLAKMNNTSTLIWAITGMNFGRYYVEHGVDSVISDPSPFFMLPGPAKLAIWRRTK